jgi:hypothetical protein
MEDRISLDILNEQREFDYDESVDLQKELVL